MKQATKPLLPGVGNYYTVKITDLNSNGEGVGRVNDFVTFIPETIPGDLVEIQISEVKKSFARGVVIRLIENSPDRICASCAVSKNCGGCQLQHMEYKAQLNWKENQVNQALQRIGKLDVLASPIIGMETPNYYRNKAQLPVGVKDDTLIIGFYRKGTHDIVDYTSCNILHPLIHKTAVAVKEVLAELEIPAYNRRTKQGILRHVIVRVSFTQAKLMVIFVTTTKTLVKQELLVEQLTNLVPELVSIAHNINPRSSKTILGRETKIVWGESYLIDTIGQLEFAISPASFFQVNPIQTEILYDKVKEYANLSGREVVWDLYCGTGSIGLYLASEAKKVYGVESLAAAVLDAEYNAKLNKRTNTEFICGRAEDVLPKYADTGEQIDLVILDPPRQGCESALLETISRLEVPKLIYVSCNPTTLARDLAYLSAHGYQVEQVQPVDMFPMTTHVECVVLMSRVKD